jgi:hypothetical protein
VVRSSSLRSVRPALSLLFMFGWLRRVAVVLPAWMLRLVS